MKTLIKLFIGVLSLGFVACTDDDYNADTANSPYEPTTLRAVAQVKTTNTIEGRNYSWEHNFSYDAKGRIREINSVMIHHDKVNFANVTRYYECQITSKANYFYKGEKLEVAYSVTYEFPDYPAWNTRESGTDYGFFNERGVLTRCSSLDFEYSTTQLQKAYSDIGREYIIKRDASGNVIGYVCNDIPGDSLVVDNSYKYRYSDFRNNTNFDVSAYFGYWGAEQEIYANCMPYYASYQLGAFGMLGATSGYLPKSILGKNSNGEPVYIDGNWRFEGGYPVEFVDAMGRKTVIKYVE